MKNLISIIICSLFVCGSAIAKGDATAGKQKSATCSACHGMDGNSTVPQWPKIAGQKQSYIVQQLMDFKVGEKSGRHNDTMYPIVAMLSKQDMEDLAAYFSSLPGSIGAASPKLAARGKALYRGGDLENKITACTACHGPTGQGIETAAYPRLAGQHPDYIVQQLKAFKSKERANDLNAIMRDISAKLSDDDMLAVASYINGLH